MQFTRLETIFKGPPPPIPLSLLTIAIISIYRPLAQSTYSMPSSHSTSQPDTNQPNIDGSQTRKFMNSDALRRLTLVLLSWLIIFGSIITIAWLILKPQPPYFGVNALTVSNFTLSGSQIRGNYDIEIFIRNPNKKLNLYFSNFNISVFYRRTCISKTSLASLSLEEMNHTTLRAQLRPDLGYYVKAKELKDLVGNLNSIGVVNFDVKMSVSTTFSAGNLLQVKRSIDVSCKNLKIIFSSSKLRGKLEGKRVNCVVSSWDESIS